MSYLVFGLTLSSLQAVLKGLPLLEELHLDGVQDQEELDKVQAENAPNLRRVTVKYDHSWSWGEPMSRREASEWREKVDGMGASYDHGLEVSVATLRN